ncbi:MAG: hypothetical protein A2Z99_06105 [Treponema sp. GWB1_62_6]|nr:MAG: hypothetical protein A2Z99_06105 [Treponema sp. GWB1_62_6]
MSKPFKFLWWTLLLVALALPLGGQSLRLQRPWQGGTVPGAASFLSTITMADDQWFGLGVAKGRVEFDDNTTDEINFLGCNVGIGTSTPTMDLSFGGDTDRNIRVMEHASAAGKYLQLQGGNAATGATDTAAGYLYLSAGNSTGTGAGYIVFKVPTPGTTGTTTRTTTAMARIASLGLCLGENSTPGGRLQLSGNLSSSAWTTGGVLLRVAQATLTDTTSSGVVAAVTASNFGQPTLAASVATTYTDASTVRIANAPAAGSNVTLTAPWALWVDDGNTRLDGNLRVYADPTASATTALVRLGDNALVGGDADGTFLAIGADNGFVGDFLNFQVNGSRILGVLGTGEVRLSNNTWISAVDAAGTGVVNLFWIDANDQIEVGAPLALGGNLELAEDGGLQTFADLSVTATPPDGTEEGGVLRVDGNNVLGWRAESDAAGGVDNRRVRYYGDTGSVDQFVYQADALADDGTVTLPTAVTGIILVSCNAESGFWQVQSDGTVTKIAGSTNTAAADSDGNLCVYDGGTGAVVKNRLGATGDMEVIAWIE